MSMTYPLRPRRYAMTRAERRAEIQRVAVEIKRIALKAGWSIRRHNQARTRTIYLRFKTPEGKKRSIRVSDHIAPEPTGSMLSVVIGTPGALKLAVQWLKAQTRNA